MYSVQYVIKVHGHTEVFVTRVGQSKLVGGLTMCQLINTESECPRSKGHGSRSTVNVSRLTLRSNIMTGVLTCGFDTSRIVWLATDHSLNNNAVLNSVDYKSQMANTVKISYDKCLM